MKVKLNQLTPLTTNSFKINDLEIDLNIPTIKNINEYIITGIDKDKIIINSKIQNKKLTSKIGLEFSKYLETTIIVPKNIIIDNPIELEYTFEKEEPFINQLNIILEENSKADFIIQYKSLNQKEHFNYLKECLTSKKNSNGTISYINSLNKNSTNMISIESTQEQSSNIKHNIIDIGGKIRIYNSYMELLEKTSINELNTIYLGKKDSIIDINYDLKNIAEKTENYLNVEGVLTDQSRKKFRGIIDFKKGSFQSIGKEYENCLLLSDKCKSTSLPMLLCHEEDVIGSHGESTGMVSPEKLFYLMSRGLAKKEAERLIVIANFNKIIEQIPKKETRERILKEINKQL